MVTGPVEVMKSGTGLGLMDQMVSGVYVALLALFTSLIRIFLCRSGALV